LIISFGNQRESLEDEMKEQIKQGIHMALSILIIGSIILACEYMAFVQIAEVVK
jgi:hypothetical protein